MLPVCGRFTPTWRPSWGGSEAAVVPAKLVKLHASVQSPPVEISAGSTAKSALCLHTRLPTGGGGGSNSAGRQKSMLGPPGAVAFPYTCSVYLWSILHPPSTASKQAPTAVLDRGPWSVDYGFLVYCPWSEVPPPLLLVLAPCSLVPCSEVYAPRSMVRSLWIMVCVHGSWFIFLGSCIVVRGSLFMVRASWFGVHGSCFMVRQGGLQRLLSQSVGWLNVSEIRDR